jgi:hypothetical protein
VRLCYLFWSLASFHICEFNGLRNLYTVGLQSVANKIDAVNNSLISLSRLESSTQRAFNGDFFANRGDVEKCLSVSKWPGQKVAQCLAFRDKSVNKMDVTSHSTCLHLQCVWSSSALHMHMGGLPLRCRKTEKTRARY